VTQIVANRLSGFELARYGLVGGDADAGVEVADGLKKRRIPVPVEAHDYLRHQVLIGVVGKGNQRSLSWLAHRVEDDHNSFANFGGFLSGKLDELWDRCGTSWPHNLKHPLSVVCGCHLVSGASKKALCDCFVFQPERQLAVAREDSITFGVVSDLPDQQGEVVGTQKDQRLILMFIPVLLEPFMHGPALVAGLAGTSEESCNDSQRGRQSKRDENSSTVCLGKWQA